MFLMLLCLDLCGSLWQYLIITWVGHLHSPVPEVRQLYLVFVEQPLEVREVLITHVQLTATRKDVD